MKKQSNRKSFRWITKTLALVMTFIFAVGMVAGCKKKEEAPENELYNQMQGVNLSQGITALADKGKSSYKIVIAENASPTEEYGAEELQKYIKQSTGATLEIVRDNSGVMLGQKLLSVGNTRFVKETGLNTNDLNRDGFRIKTQNETVMIKGQIDRGTLYGVYDFLEKFIGVRFLSEAYEYVPELQNVPLYEMDIIEIPDIQSRSHNSRGTASTDPASLAKRRFVAGKCKADSTKYGGGYEEDWATPMHAYDAIVSTAEYGTDHPEWFTQAGSSEKGGNQWTLSNGLTNDGKLDTTMEESLLKQAIENIKAILTEDKQAIYVGIGINDNWEACDGNNCQCAGKCEEQRNLFGGHAAHAVVFNNVVIEEINKWQKEIGDERDIKFVMYAYLYTLGAPNQDAPFHELAIPHEDLYILACPYSGHAYNAAFNDQEKNSKFYGIVKSWQAITNRICIFDYPVNFAEQLAWFPNISYLKTNLQWYKELGSLRVVSDDSRQTECYEWLLVDYLLSRLMWNVNRDVNALISEFNSLYFGEKAGAVMDEFVSFNEAHFTKAANATGTWQYASCTGEGTWLHSAETLSVDYLRHLQRLVDSAINEIQTDKSLTDKQKKDYVSHMGYVQIQIDHMKFINYGELFSTTDEEDKAFYQAYYNKLQKYKIEKLGLNTSIKSIFNALGVY